MKITCWLVNVMEKIARKTFIADCRITKLKTRVN